MQPYNECSICSRIGNDNVIELVLENISSGNVITFRRRESGPNWMYSLNSRII